MAREDEYRACARCDEASPHALRASGDLCRNCADTTHPRIPHCPICWRADVPAEGHHVAGERQREGFVVRLCLNCHALLTYRQVTAWDPSWLHESHPVRCLAQGTYDLTCLWWERSPAVAMLRELLDLLVRAAVELLACLALRGWDFA
jgi:hypothetical protein